MRNDVNGLAAVGHLVFDSHIRRVVGRLVMPVEPPNSRSIKSF